MAKRDSTSDNKETKAEDSTSGTAVLSGTTLRVYRFLYREAKPLNIHDVQRGLGLSSASVAQYHLRKLVQAGLVKEQDEGYVVDKMVFENMIRIRRAVIPFQITYAVFFATLLAVLLIFLRNSSDVNSVFAFALAVTVSALVLFSFEALRTLKRQSI